MKALLIFIALTISVAGCAPKAPPLPTFPPMSDEQTLEILASRANAVRTVSAEASLELTRPDGESVRLDAAIAMQPPDRTRLRAWKLGQAVFDLTLTPEGVWLFSPEDSKRKDQIRSAGVNAAQLARTWSLLTGSFFNDKDLIVKRAGDVLVLTRGELSCEVDRDTLTVRRYRHSHFTLDFARYTVRGDVVWPMQIVATSDTGKIEIDIRELELNSELSDGAFVPPRRAEKLP